MRGGVIVHATEGVFGLACSVEYPTAMERISNLKGRNAQAQPFLLLLGNVAQAKNLVSLDVPLADAITQSWPGPTTWIFPDKTEAYPWVGGEDGSLAVRVTDHPQAQQLANYVGPLISTSANRTGQPSCLSLASAKLEFGDAVDFYLSGELLRPGHASRILHAATGKILRAS